jgi:ABC-type multidrug transport system fused ATPase/permease subunit
MEQGKIIETGSPDELMRPGTRCHELFETQLTQNQMN